MIVVDASVIYKWLVSENMQSDLAAKKILADFKLEKLSIIVPDILLYELANALTSKTTTSLVDIKKLWQRFAAYKLPIFSPAIDFITKSIDFSRKYKVSVYDATYAVLALENKCNLITADDKFADQINLPFVKKLSSIF